MRRVLRSPSVAALGELAAEALSPVVTTPPATVKRYVCREQGFFPNLAVDIPNSAADWHRCCPSNFSDFLNPYNARDFPVTLL
jgi:hypothetical protein